MYSRKPPFEREIPSAAVEDRELLAGLFASRQDAAESEVGQAIGQVRHSLGEPGLRAAWQNWFAPLARLEGCWLRGAVTIRNAHTRLGSGLLELQRVFFHQSGHPGFPLPRERTFTEDIRWLEALGREGAAFPAAVLGVTAAHARLGGGLFAVDRARDYRKILSLADRLLGIWPVESGERRQAMAAGSRYRRMTLGWCRRWLAGTSLEARVLAMFRAKAKYGLGYHGNIRIGDRSLDEWLESLAEGKGEAFLRVFPGSPYLDCRRPHACRFFRHSTAFGGPMFGVFEPGELALLRRWVRSRAAPTAGAGRGPVGGYCPEAPPERPVSKGVGRFQVPKKMDPPLLYHYLVSGRDPGAAMPAARRWVDKILARARWLGKGFFPYSPEAFCRYIDTLHERASRRRPRPAARLRLSRGAWVWGIEQFAPAILVDGCWLAESLPLAREMPDVGERLWRIWRDELGDGHLSRHHGNIYRRLLETAGVALPPFDSEAFIRHRGFVTGAFDLPAFLLAIGQSPGRYLPEILGLNLAIELSGLGGRYRALAEGMEAVGLDSTIVRLHQSIDNLACGHAALARDAIIVYLQRFEAGGEAAVQGQWRRIWTGWQALTPASLRFSVHLLAGWACRFGVCGTMARTC